MKLLSAGLSPFAARVRVAIYAGGLPVEIAPSGMWTPEGRKAPEYLALNPIGKVPTLVFDDGTALPESETIVEYLADSFPAANLRPADPKAAARARLLARITELYVLNAGMPLFMQLNPAGRNQEAIAGAMAAMETGLAQLEHFMPGDAFAVGDHLTTADCAMAPYLYFMPHLFAQGIGGRSLLGGQPRVAAWWERIQAVPPVAKVLDEMLSGLAASPLKMVLE